jgi:protein-disulfide isomerase
MPFIGADSVSAAEATYCANDQGMYWEYHTTLYQLQQHENDGWANIDRLTAIAFIKLFSV